MTFSSLPRIKEHVQHKAAFIDTELESLPEPMLGNLPVLVMGELGRFRTALEKQIDGESQMCPFQNRFHNLATRFRQTLANTKPLLKFRDAGLLARRLTTGETPKGRVGGTPTPKPRMQAPAISVDTESGDESEVNSPMATHKSGSKRPFNTPDHTPSKSQRVDSGFTQTSPSKVQSRCFTLPEVRNVIHRGYISLPGHVEPKAIEELIRLSMAHWEEPVDYFLDQTKKLCQQTVFELVQTIFKHRRNTSYFTKILSVCDTFLEDALEIQLQLVKRILGWELSKPKTLNERAMYQARHDAQTLLLSHRRKVLALPFVDEQEEKTERKSLGAQREENFSKVPDSELVPETFGPELKAIAVGITELLIRTQLTPLDRRLKRTMKLPTAASLTSFASVYIMNSLRNVANNWFHILSKNSECWKQTVNITLPLPVRRLTDFDAAQDRMAILLAVDPTDEERRAVLKKEKATIAKAMEQLEALV